MPSATTAPIMGSPSRVRHAARRLARGAALMGGYRSQSRLPGPHECADELAVDGGDRLRAEPGAGEKVARALGRVDSGRLHGDVFEAGLRELAPVLGLLERTGDAANP